MERDFLNEAVKCGERCVLVIDNAAIRKNAEYIIKMTGKKLIAVVKANAYGHGLAKVVGALSGMARMFAVATVEEAAEVNACGEKALILSPPDCRGIRALAGANVAVAVQDKEGARAAAACGVPVHVAVDTGMHRFGADWRDVGTLLEICDTPGLKTEGLFTHFSSADCEDLSFTTEQQRRFASVAEVLGKERFRYIHCANSAAALRIPAYGNAVRPGLALYGVNPDFCCAPLTGASGLYAKVLSTSLLREGESVGYGGAYPVSGMKRIAVLGAGYADGLPYSLKNPGSVFINGTFCRTVGNVCMDSAFADVTHAVVEAGDYAQIFGGFGETGYSAAARKAGIVPHRVMTGVSARVKRIYFD